MRPALLSDLSISVRRDGIVTCGGCSSLKLGRGETGGEGDVNAADRGMDTSLACRVFDNLNGLFSGNLSSPFGLSACWLLFGRRLWGRSSAEASIVWDALYGWYLVASGA